ncbi:MAG: hypothetical protein NPIRA05_17240 [Nitrospirales bacterium]|nr:MAG: hypothetical protein NPIRA05_17240 [Nitrospirales bacterium]
MLVWDMPFGVIKDLDWDQEVSEDDFKQVIEDFAAKNQKSQFSVLLHVPWNLAGRYDRILRDLGMTTIPFSWYKPNFNAKNVRYLQSFELMIFACTSRRVTWNDSKNPLLRHNILNIPKVTTRLRHTGTKEVVNATQKPPAIARKFFKRHTTRGDEVLILSSGTGSEAIAAVSLGLNVTCVDFDSEQMAKCEERVIDFMSADNLKQLVAEPLLFRDDTDHELSDDESTLCETLQLRKENEDKAKAEVIEPQNKY